MAYSITWNTGIPTNATVANTIDDEFRNLKTSIEERMNDKFVTSWSADPIVAKPEIKGDVTGKILVIHWSDFNLPAYPYAPTIPVNGDYIQHDNSFGSQYYYAPLLIPNGVTITRIRHGVDPGIGTVTTKILAVTVATGAFGDPGFSAASTGIGYVVGTSGVISYLVGPGFSYYLRHQTNNNAVESKFYFAEIEYTTPDCRNTL